MKWRVIPLDTTNAFAAMAIDEAVSEGIEKGGPPTIRFWRWNPSAVSIGYFQNVEDELDLEECKKLRVDVVRRRTGGGAVYHDYDGEITYSVIGKEELFPKGITESYYLICGWVIDSLTMLGIHAEFKPINDIVVNGKKISGNAQTRRNGILLQHGTILVDLDVKKMFSLLKVGKEKISDKMIQTVEERVARIKDFGSFEMQAVYDALVQGFTAAKDWEFGKLTDEELKRAKELAKERYSSEEWTFLR